MKMRATERLEFALDLTQRLTQRPLREQIFLLAPEQPYQFGSRQLPRAGENHIAEKRLRLAAEVSLLSIHGRRKWSDDLQSQVANFSPAKRRTAVGSRHLAPSLLDIVDESVGGQAPRS